MPWNLLSFIFINDILQAIFGITTLLLEILSFFFRVKYFKSNMASENDDSWGKKVSNLIQKDYIVLKFLK